VKPLASVSLDLDNKWSYMKTRGDPAWEALPSYLDVVVPRVLKFLTERGLTITVLVVGQDAAVPGNRDLLASVAEAGHEIGNHSFLHEPWLHLYSPREIEEEIVRAELAICQATGKRPIGFRGPGFSSTPAVREILARRGYLYDASTLPTFIGPLARVYYFLTSGLGSAERRKRKALFGGFGDVLRPNRARVVEAAGHALVDLPVTTMPFVRTPIHVSYVLYLSRYSKAAARAYVRLALRLALWTGTEPSLLLHPLDFASREDAPELAFFPAMDLPLREKLELLGFVLDTLEPHFGLTTLETHARAVLERALQERGVSARAAA
jgi:peptidoglycan/xylan/chitin deacetylase (PgdA/CDA1 family)